MPVTVSVPCAPPGTDTAASAVTSTPLWYSLPFSTFNSVPPMLTVASAPCSSILNEPSVAAPKAAWPVSRAASPCRDVAFVRGHHARAARRASLNSGAATVFTVTDCSRPSPSPSVTVTFKYDRVVPAKSGVSVRTGGRAVVLVRVQLERRAVAPARERPFPLAFVPVGLAFHLPVLRPRRPAPGVKLRNCP